MVQVAQLRVEGMTTHGVLWVVAIVTSGLDGGAHAIGGGLGGAVVVDDTIVQTRKALLGGLAFGCRKRHDTAERRDRATCTLVRGQVSFWLSPLLTTNKSRKTHTHTHCCMVTKQRGVIEEEGVKEPSRLTFFFFLLADGGGEGMGCHQPKVTLTADTKEKK